MGFFEEFKRLEKLCGEVMGDNHGVSAYIDEMINLPQGTYLVKDWDEDLKRLKHYRWARNQIAHSPDCCEENMCNSEDIQWLIDFYSRIMTQTDPLALYRKATQPRSVSVSNKINKQPYLEQPYHEQTSYNYNNQRTKRTPRGCGIGLIIVLVSVITFTVWALLQVLK